jgi:hypothetical protein
MRTLLWSVVTLSLLAQRNRVTASCRRMVDAR